MADFTNLESDLDAMKRHSLGSIIGHRETRALKFSDTTRSKHRVFDLRESEEAVKESNSTWEAKENLETTTTTESTTSKSSDLPIATPPSVPTELPFPEKATSTEIPGPTNTSPMSSEETTMISITEPAPTISKSPWVPTTRPPSVPTEFYFPKKTPSTKIPYKYAITKLLYFIIKLLNSDKEIL